MESLHLRQGVNIKNKIGDIIEANRGIIKASDLLDLWEIVLDDCQVVPKKILDSLLDNMSQLDYGMIPNYYDMPKANPELLTNTTLFEGIVNAYHHGNIGTPSNEITKVWMTLNPSSTVEEIKDAIWSIYYTDPDNKLSLIMDYTRNPRDVADPYWTGDFETTYQDIDLGVREFYKFLTAQKNKK